MSFVLFDSTGRELRQLSGTAAGDLTGSYPNPTIANDAVTAAKIAAGSVGGSELAAAAKNVVTDTKTDTFVSTSTTFEDVTGLAVTITPSATTSKILIVGMLTGAGTGGQTNFFARLLRGSTAIAVGDASGNRIQCTVYAHDANNGHTHAFTVLDEPSTTSATTYKIQVRTQTAGQGTTINRTSPDGNGTDVGRTFSSITAIEVLA